MKCRFRLKKFRALLYCYYWLEKIKNRDTGMASYDVTCRLIFMVIGRTVQEFKLCAPQMQITCVCVFIHRAIISDRTENTKILKLCSVPLSLATHGCHSCQAKVQVLIWNEHLFPLSVTNWLRYCSRCLLLYWQRELTYHARGTVMYVCFNL